MKQQTCKFILPNGSKCGSVFHTAMFHKPKTPIKRTAIKPSYKSITAGKFESIETKPVSLRHARKKKTEGRSPLVKRLDNVFSKYIRKKYAVDGMTACVTCGVVKRWQEQQNGHYMSRGHLPTRWDEENCAPQCVACNVFKKGNYTEYVLWMIDKYGVDKLEELKVKANSGLKITTIEIREIIEKYSELSKSY